MADLMDPFDIDPDRRGPEDRVVLWRETRLAGLECLSATFAQYEFVPHMHDTYGIGLTEFGCQRHYFRGVQQYSGPGTLWLMEPGEVHDGRPYGGAYGYRMTFPTVALIEELAGELTGRAGRNTVTFRGAVIDDPVGFRLLRAAHTATRTAPGDLEAEELMLRAYAHVLTTHADIAPHRPGPAAASALEGVRDRLEDEFATSWRLETLAREAGLTRTRLIRDFRRRFGLTPHAYLLDARTRRARKLLASGHSPVAVADACGFADQSHLTRVFKARVGITPGAFARAL